MSYEADPITRKLATHCIICYRPLRKAESVEGCMGPVCAKRHGFYLDKPEDEKRVAAAILYKMAFEPDAEVVLSNIGLLYLMGWTNLAKVIALRYADVHVDHRKDYSINGAPTDVLLVTTPYSDAALGTWRSIPGRMWDKKLKVNVVPYAQRAQLLDLLVKHYPGQLVWSNDEQTDVSFKVDGVAKRLTALPLPTKPVVEPAPVAQSTTAPQPAPVASTAKPKAKGVGARVKELLQQSVDGKGLSHAVILETIKAEFPEGSTSASCVSWYASKLKKDGVSLPPR